MRGFSLIETILSIFLLASAGLILVELIYTASTRESQARAGVRATLVARHTLEMVSAWGDDPANFRSSWALYSPADFQEGDYKVHVDILPGLQGSLSPNGSLQRVGDLRTLVGSCKSMTVKVSWGRGQSISLSRLKTEPARRVQGIQVREVVPSGGAPMVVNETRQYEAQLIGGDNTPIPGVPFHWSVRQDATVPGNGGLSVSDNMGQRAVLINHYDGPDPTVPPFTANGTVYVEAGCVYNGTYHLGASAGVQLAP